MNSLQGLLYGLSIAATPANLLAAFVGAFAGTAIGVLPGLGPVAGVALILPLTFSLDPTAGLIMMAGIFYGSMYGGSTTAILLNIPGESASVVTAILVSNCMNYSNNRHSGARRLARAKMCNCTSENP